MMSRRCARDMVEVEALSCRRYARWRVAAQSCHTDYREIAGLEDREACCAPAPRCFIRPASLTPKGKTNAAYRLFSNAMEFTRMLSSFMSVTECPPCRNDGHVT